MLRFATHRSAAFSASRGFLASRRAAASAATYSEAVGPTGEVQLLDQLAGYYVNIQSRKMYYKDFLRFEHQAVRWAFSDIRKNTEALAHGLLQTGVRPGHRVLAIQPSNCESLVLQLACAKVGALCCIMPHFNLSADKLRYYLNEFQPSHFIGREWIAVPEKKANGDIVERNLHFWDIIYNVIPELGLSYPGQKFQWTHSQEFFFLKKTIITDHNMNLLCTTPMRRILVWGPYSYYEQRLRRMSMLLHPDDPILCLEDPTAVAEDKAHVVFSHRNCVNAGYIFAQLMGLTAETRIGMMPNHHIDPVGAIVAPYAALTSGAVLVQLHDNLFTDGHAIQVIEKLCVEEVKGILGRRADFDLVLKHSNNFDPDQFEHLKWVAIFEDGVEQTATSEYLQQLAQALHLEDIFVFRGPMESGFMLSWRSLKRGDLGLVPHSSLKIVGDRGTTDAKVLAANARGNLKLKGPQMTSFFFNNAGLLTETVDDQGFVSTSREAVFDEKQTVTLFGAQTY
jgi:fatty-acyl-CoA synthase